MCNGTGLYKIWLIASTDNGQVFWVLSAVCFVGSNLGSSDLWPVQLGTSTFLLALYSTDYWFPFKMWRPSHSDHNQLINVSSSSSPAVVITTIREIEHSGTTLPGSSFLSAWLSLSPSCFFFTFSHASSSCLLFFSTCTCARACMCVCFHGVLAKEDKHQAPQWDHLYLRIGAVSALVNTVIYRLLITQWQVAWQQQTCKSNHINQGRSWRA